MYVFWSRTIEWQEGRMVGGAGAVSMILVRCWSRDAIGVDYNLIAVTLSLDGLGAFRLS